MRNNGVESSECLPKSCRSSADCESEYHTCDDYKCKCIATHFDPHTALCYKFGSIGGESNSSVDSSSDINGKLQTPNGNDNGNDGNVIKSILKDLTMNGDRIWPIMIVLIVLTLILLAIMVCLVRKYCLGYCWTTHKKEYEPNSTNPAKSGQQFDKNSINNKSFRRKKGELGEEENDHDHYDDDGGANESDEIENTAAADRSNLVTTTKKSTNSHNGANNYHGGKNTSHSSSKNSNGNGYVTSGKDKH